MLYFTKCYARNFPPKNGNRNHHTHYFLEENHSRLTFDIMTHGLLEPIEDITSEDYEFWKKSFNPRDYLKQKDYETITSGLKDFGRLLGQSWIKNRNKPASIQDPDTVAGGFRKLKVFEKKALLEGIVSATNYIHLKPQQ
ncbi:MAG: hypothetical protein ACP5NW_04740 [Candidatus Woesearchaeota archaeon]